ncbi:hypothetical protein P7K49_026109, partial [Saguinus oedipus]
DAEFCLVIDMASSAVDRQTVLVTHLFNSARGTAPAPSVLVLLNSLHHPLEVCKVFPILALGSSESLGTFKPTLHLFPETV